MSEKDLIKQELKRILEQDLDLAKDVGESLSSFKNQDDMKQESKYDTRSIEAGYLSSAQNKRIEELKGHLKLVELMPIKIFSAKDEIALGAIVRLQDKDYFLSQVCGGVVLDISGKKIHVISVLSPLGKELISMNVGDSIELDVNGQTQEILIQSVR